MNRSYECLVTGKYRFAPTKSATETVIHTDTDRKTSRSRVKVKIDFHLARFHLATRMETVNSGFEFSTFLKPDINTKLLNDDNYAILLIRK